MVSVALPSPMGGPGRSGARSWGPRESLLSLGI